MKAYASYFRLRLQAGLQYRTAGWAGVATQFYWGFLLLMVYEAFYRSASGTQPISLEQLAAYVWLQQAFLAFIMLWFRDSELAELIVTGNVAYELCRPVNLYGFWYARLLAQRLAAATLRCIPILVVASFLPKPLRLPPPASLLAAAGFAASLVAALLIVVGMSMLIQVFTFWTLSPAGTTLLFAMFSEFLSGGVLAIPLMPEGLQKVLYFLPFAYTADVPFRIYSGHTLTGDIPGLVLRQLAWALALILVGALFMRRAMRRVVVQGG